MKNVFCRTIILLAIGLIINATLITASYYTFKITKNKINIIENEILMLDKQHLEIHSLRENLTQIKKIETDIADYEKHIFLRKDKLDDLRLIEDLEALAHKNKVTQKIITSNIDNIKSEKIEITLSTTGNYTNIFEYLNDLENYIYFINIEKIELTPQIARTQDDNLPVNLLLKISLYAQQYPTN